MYAPLWLICNKLGQNSGIKSSRPGGPTAAGKAFWTYNLQPPRYRDTASRCRSGALGCLTVAGVAATLLRRKGQIRGSAILARLGDSLGGEADGPAGVKEPSQLADLRAGSTSGDLPSPK